MKTITISLTRYPDLLSGLISVISRSEYSHISISLDELVLFYVFCIFLINFIIVIFVLSLWQNYW